MNSQLQHAVKPMEQAVVRELDGPVLVLAVTGELDIATVPQLRRELQTSMDRGTTRIVVDLSRVSFVDSVSVAVLVKAAHRLGEEGRFAVVVESDSYGMLIFEAGGIDAVLELFETRADAVAHARG
jgi:anti-sigma B factor antagonist